MGVSMKPGATALTVMLREAISMAMALVRPIRPAFCGDVIGLAGVAHLRDDGGDIDDAAGAGAHHGGERLLDAEMGAGQIGSNDASQSSSFHTKREAVAGDCGVVHENIQTPYFSMTCLKPAFNLFGVGSSIFYGDGFTTRGTKFLPLARRVFLRCARHGNFCAGWGDSQGGVAANAWRLRLPGRLCLSD